MIPVRICLPELDPSKATWRYASTKKGVVKLCEETKSILLTESIPFLRDEGRAEIYFALLLDCIEKHILAIRNTADFNEELVTGYEVVIKRITLEPLTLQYFSQKGGAFPNLETLNFEYIVLGYTQDLHVPDPQAIMMDDSLRVGAFTPVIKSEYWDETEICQQIVKSLCAPLAPLEESYDLCSKLATGAPDEMREALQGAVFTIRLLQSSLDRLSDLKQI